MTAARITVESVPLDELTLLPGNPRRGDVNAVARSLDRFGQRKPVVISADGTVIAGNHTVLAARQLGWTHVDANRVDDDEATAKAYALADNRTAALGGFDDEDLAAMLAEVEAADPSLLAAASYDSDDLAKLMAEPGPGTAGDDLAAPTLADRFLIPPFTVLDGRSYWWRKRKSAWLANGLRSEAGRGALLAYDSVTANPDYYRSKAAVEKKLGRTLTNEEFQREHYAPTDRASQAYGTSVFDPVLCEVIYRWFMPPDGLILDPWAGGSVRALVAALLGRRYVGIELRGDQIAANEEQAGKVLGPDHPAAPRWLHGDCLAVLPKLEEDADLIIGCPPYFDLERYSDGDPRDLSMMSDGDFADTYTKMVAAAAARLKPDRFAVLVVSSVRGKNRGGPLRDLHGLTVDAGQDAGLKLYNEAVLINPAGSVPIRVARMFSGARTLGRIHQDVLIFVKGDPKRAAIACGDVDVDSMAEALALIGKDQAGELDHDDGGGEFDLWR